jgi:HSP20 family protein
MGGEKMTEKEEKKEIEVKASEERIIEPWYPSDIFRAFDDVWDGFRRDFTRPWRPWRLRGRPWWRRPFGAMVPRREACVDLADLEKEFQVYAEIPGIPKDKIDITVTKDSIEISGKSKVEKREEKKGYVVRERGYSQIYRRISFPEEVLPDKVTATIKDGLLDIRVPKKMPTPKLKKHKVEIK